MGVAALVLFLGYMIGIREAAKEFPAKITASIIECGRLQSQKNPNPNSLYVRLRVDLHDGKHGTVLCLK
ncbi:hypothetical protein COB80_02830 [Candidatus Kaiserbacteria bacterium]|nr:MAG: hypothetical protein COB80_02830 [Candidatus Kaiserbacteria bacterium]